MNNSDSVPTLHLVDQIESVGDAEEKAEVLTTPRREAEKDYGSIRRDQTPNMKIILEKSEPSVSTPIIGGGTIQN